jgi:hypothetical protein
MALVPSARIQWIIGYQGWRRAIETYVPARLMFSLAVAAIIDKMVPSLLTLDLEAVRRGGGDI